MLGTDIAVAVPLTHAPMVRRDHQNVEEMVVMTGGLRKGGASVESSPGMTPWMSRPVVIYFSMRGNDPNAVGIRHGRHPLDRAGRVHRQRFQMVAVGRKGAGRSPVS